jgi:radical SAM superfamily enzyme
MIRKNGGADLQWMHTDTAKQRKRTKMTNDEFIESFREALERLELESEVIIIGTDTKAQISIPASWGAEKTEKVFKEVHKYIHNKNKQNRKNLH